MSEGSKFWYSLLVPAGISALAPLIAFSFGYGVLMQRVDVIGTKITELDSEFKGTSLTVVKLEGSLASIANMEAVLAKHGDAVQQLALIVAANTKELQIRFGDVNAKLLPDERTCATGDLSYSWGICPKPDGFSHHRLDELVAGMGWGTYDSELGETWIYSEGLASADKQPLLPYEPALPRKGDRQQLPYEDTPTIPQTYSRKSRALSAY